MELNSTIPQSLTIPTSSICHRRLLASKFISFLRHERSIRTLRYYQSLTNDGKKIFLENIVSSEKKFNNTLNPDMVRIKIIDMARVGVVIHYGPYSKRKDVARFFVILSLLFIRRKIRIE